MSPPTARARKANTANACNAVFFMVRISCIKKGLPVLGVPFRQGSRTGATRTIVLGY